ncbi:MAG: thioredoxin-like negative regulator of GroEL [Cellvibrionaceae bacterium]|jgi:thioredoxin-like negative regulator of GroEL
MTPVLERIVSEHDSGFVLAKVNARRNPETVVKNSVRSTPSVRIYHNGKMVEGFSGGRLEHQVRNLMSQIRESEPPTPGVKLSDNPNQRYKQARSHLKRGRGLEATVALRDFPEGVEAANASLLLPLARFLWDLDDGDRWTGKRKIDDLYHLALDWFDDKKPENALIPLRDTLSLLPKDDRQEMELVIKGLKFLVN